MNKLKEIWENKWVKFSLASAIYILLFVVWPGNAWMLFGLIFIYDAFISKLFYRKVWSKHKALKARSKWYKSTMEWVEAIVFAVVFISLLKMFIFGMYVIPTPSMEKTLLVGDYLFVSKITYGPTVPNTPLSFPMVHNTMPLSDTKRSYSEAIKWKYHRLKGFRGVKRGDIVVFNFPAGDTVILERRAETYYDILRAYEQAFGKKEGRERLYKEYTVISHPVDKRENYVKRCVGLPGDTLTISSSELIVNGEKVKETARMQHSHYVKTTSPLNTTTLQKLGLARYDYTYYQSSGSYEIDLTKGARESIEAMGNVTRVVKHIEEAGSGREYIFPHDGVESWNEDNFGPMWIPAKGVEVELTMKNIGLYGAIIHNYEGNKLEIRDSIIYINDTPSSSYRFNMDYYFMMGDNRNNSADSRFWGFVPEDHIVGKVSFVWFSLDPEKSFPANIRWSKMFRKIE